MPFVGRDIRFLRSQVSAYSLLTDPDHIIPMNDVAAWQQFPEHHWVYNKLELLQRAGIPCGPFGIEPDAYPACVKPITNLRGCGLGNTIVHSPAEYEAHGQPGMFWMPALDGPHLSHEFAVCNGEVAWSCCFEGHPIGDGMFDYWNLTACPDDLHLKLTQFIGSELLTYTGICNIETISGTMIECHLRIGDSFKVGDLDFMNAVIQLYDTGTWHYLPSWQSYFLFTVFGPQDTDHQIPATLWQHLEEQCICAHQTTPEARRKFPLAGGRIAILGTPDYELGLQSRSLLIEQISPPLPQRYTASLVSQVSEMRI